MQLALPKYQINLTRVITNWKKIIFGIIIFLIVLFEAQGEGDFNIFISASKDLFQGKNIYKEFYNEWFHYYYSVCFAILLYPLTFLPLYVAKVIWLSLNLFFLYRIWNIISGFLPITILNKKNQTLFVVFSFVFVFRFILDNIHLAQMTIFILYLILEGLKQILNGNEIGGSFLIALGIDIKLLPLVLIGYLLYRNNWKSCLYIIVFLIILTLIPVFFIGVEQNNFLLNERWKLINPINQEHVLDTTERSFHSITTFLAVLLVEDCGDYHALTIKRNIANISIQNLLYVINAVRLILIGFTLYFIRMLPFKKSTSNLQTLYELSYICVLIPLVFPHQQHYAFFFIFPGIAYLIFYIIFLYFDNKPFLEIEQKRANKPFVFIMLCIVFILTSSHLILGQFNDYYNHFKTLTYGIILLIPLLAICKPSHIEMKIKLFNSFE